MKKTFFLSFIFALAAMLAQAQTVAITSTSVEIITPNAVTRTFYDLDDVYLAYKTGKFTIYDVNTGTQLFYGDTSEVAVAGALIYSAKATKLARWYQSCTHTNGYRYFMPRRDVSYLYRGATSVIRFLNKETKKTLLETHVDSVTVSGVSGASAKLTWLRNQAFLEATRNAGGLPELPTVAAGAAAGSGATATLVGCGNGVTVTLTTGTTATNSGVLFTVTLPYTALTGIVPDVDAGDADAAAHKVRWFSTATTTTIVLNATGTALSDSTAYVFHVTGIPY